MLLITFGALSSAWLPLLTALLGVGIGLLSLTAATGIFTLSSTTPVLAIMLGLAVGIDYSLFILSRHRQQLQDGIRLEESIGRAVATSGSAVIFAGLTVVIALAGLLIVSIPFLTAMGLAAAGTVAVSVLIAISLLPALLGFFGARMLQGKLQEPWRPSARIGVGWARFVTGRPVGPARRVALLGLLALPALHLRLGLPGANTQPKHRPSGAPTTC